MKILSIAELLKEGKLILYNCGFNSYSLEAELILAELVANGKREKLFAMMSEKISRTTYLEFQKLIQRRLSHEPVSQIIGRRWFWDSEFMVNRDVLTPRNDTEILIEAALRAFPRRESKINILDLGTGSGCLAITLALLFPNSSVLACDISAAALEVAKHNADKHSVTDRVQFTESNWFSNIRQYRYDLIVCNPPYIALSELAELDKDVKDFEPEIALTDFVDGYCHYRIIGAQLEEYLSHSSIAIFEVGFGQAENVASIFKGYGYKVKEVLKDLGGIDRCVVLSRSFFA